MEMFTTTEFWIAVGQIILIDILLGGDNAVVIALACRKLPPKQRTQGIVWGTAGAIVLRVGADLLRAARCWRSRSSSWSARCCCCGSASSCCCPSTTRAMPTSSGSDKLWGAVKTVIVADFVMSLDNVIAIAGAAEAAGGDHSMALVIFGMLVSIPIIVWGSQLVIRLMDRFPIIITLGGMLLGWIAGTMAVTDPVLIDPQVMPQVPKLPSSAWLRYARRHGRRACWCCCSAARWPRGRGTPAAWRPTVARAPAARGALRRVLLAVDGSEEALRAVRQLPALRQELREPAASWNCT